MTSEIASETPREAEFRAERLHEWVVNTLGIDTDDVLVIAHGDGTLSAQLAPSAGTGDEPTVYTMDLPYGRSGYTGSYDDAPGLSIDVHTDYVEEVNVPAIRRDAVAVLVRVVDEMNTRKRTDR